MPTATPDLIAFLKAKRPDVLNATMRQQLGVDAPAAPRASARPSQHRSGPVATQRRGGGAMEQYCPALILGAAWAISDKDRRRALPLSYR